MRDPLHLLAAGRVKRGSARTPQQTPPELREPLATLGLSWPTTLDAVKSRYKELAKRHHPDANGGDQTSGLGIDYLDRFAVNHTVQLLVELEGVGVNRVECQT